MLLPCFDDRTVTIGSNINGEMADAHSRTSPERSMICDLWLYGRAPAPDEIVDRSAGAINKISRHRFATQT